jgi:hypothetical protein
MENCFNTISRSILLQNPVKPYLRLVLDDDKVHCVSEKKGVWDSIKKMKHVVCNRFGLTIHTLASSCTGLIYGVRTQRPEDTTSSCAMKILKFLFRERGKDVPNLTNVIIALDRGYGDGKSLICWTVKALGNVMGTMKRTLWAPFTWDKKRWNKNDSRVFETSIGCRYIKQKFIELKEGAQAFGILVSMFYRNGFGGAVMLQSTLRAHRIEVWDRVEDNSQKNVDIIIDDPKTYFRQVESLLMKESDIAFLSYYCDGRVKFITTHQNVHEWFILRMFCVTASTVSKIIKKMAKRESYASTLHWKHIIDFYTRNSSPLPTVDLEYDDDMFWAELMLHDEDSWSWLRVNSNIDSLEESKVEALKVAISKHTQRSVPRKGCISDYFALPAEEREYFGQSIASLKKMHRDVLGKNHSEVREARTWTGKTCVTFLWKNVHNTMSNKLLFLKYLKFDSLSTAIDIRRKLFSLVY